MQVIPTLHSLVAWLLLTHPNLQSLEQVSEPAHPAATLISNFQSKDKQLFYLDRLHHSSSSVAITGPSCWSGEVFCKTRENFIPPQKSSFVVLLIEHLYAGFEPETFVRLATEKHRRSQVYQEARGLSFVRTRIPSSKAFLDRWCASVLSS